MVRFWNSNSQLTYTNALASINENLGYAALPIGSLMAWAKTITGVPALPSGWVQCDGQVLSDADSPLNGQTMPALNAANKFIRGNATSGGTGGADTHTHTFSFSTDAASGTAAQGGSSTVKYSSTHSHTVAGTSIAANNLPPYYGVVWVIRVK